MFKMYTQKTLEAVFEMGCWVFFSVCGVLLIMENIAINFCLIGLKL